MRALLERQVQAIWYDAALRPACLQTDDGRRVRVVHPGRWNQEAGPDFKDAVLIVGDSGHVEGDVEVHICPADWDLHGHGSDPRYRNVVAHVTWERGASPRTLSKNVISIWLGRCYDKLARNPMLIEDATYPHLCLDNGALRCGLAKGMPVAAIRAGLLEAGKCRLWLKARRLAGRLAEMVASGMDVEEARTQLLYEETMGAFGYRRNQRQFRSVARRVPFKVMPLDVEVAKSALMAAGGFEVWEQWGRPCNSPWRRLANAAEMFSGEKTMSLLLAAEDFSPDACRSLMRVLCGGKLLGRGRAAALLANVVVPMSVCLHGQCTVPQWLPPEDVSGLVREMAFRIFGRDHNPTLLYGNNELCIQGLIHVYREYCERFKNNCPKCSRGNMV